MGFLQPFDILLPSYLLKTSYVVTINSILKVASFPIAYVKMSIFAIYLLCAVRTNLHSWDYTSFDIARESEYNDSRDKINNFGDLLYGLQTFQDKIGERR